MPNAKPKLHVAFLTNLRRVRTERGESQRIVAERLGISPPAYHAIEQGKRCPTLTQVERLARALRVKPLELLGAPRKKSARKK